MPDREPKTVLCISSYEKGHEFMRQAKRDGCRVLLLTSQSLSNAEWPREAIDDIFYIQDNDKEWNMKDVIYGVSYLARNVIIDRIVALDDFDVEKAAALREHLRIPGMGDSTARYFRDKLAMRTRAFEEGIPVPAFIHILNYEELDKFISQTGFPLVIKPRLQAGAIGINKVNNRDECWETIHKLGDQQSFYLAEKFIEGDIFHVDSIVNDREIKFAIAHEYGKPPLEVAHDGRVFTSKTILRGSEDETALLELNEKVIKTLGLVRGISHTEFIKSKKENKFYFLETSARVGGAHIAELIEAAAGINYWAEWAKLEILTKEEKYQLPSIKNEYAGIILSLAKQEFPDLNDFDDAEVYWKLKKKFHAGIIVKSNSKTRVDQLVDSYTQRFYKEFFTSQPRKEKPGD